jgi:hypothetical protein
VPDFLALVRSSSRYIQKIQNAYSAKMKKAQVAWPLR